MNEIEIFEEKNFISNIVNEVNNDYSTMHVDKVDGYNLNRSTYFLLQITKNLQLFSKSSSFSEDSLKYTQKNIFDNLEKRLLQQINLNQSQYGVIFTNGGTDALIKTKDIIGISPNNTYSIIMNLCHSAHTLLSKSMVQESILDVDKIKTQEDINNFAQDICNKIIKLQDISMIVLNFIGTDKTGSVYSDDYLMNIKKTISKYLYKNDIGNIQIYTILDACQEFSLLKRNYELYDFIICSAHLCFGPNNLGAIIFKKEDTFLKILKRRNLYTENFLDDGHNVYFSIIIRIWLDTLEEIKLKYNHYITSFSTYIEHLLEELKILLNIDYKILMKDNFDRPSFSIAFVLPNINMELLSSQYKFDYAVLHPDFLTKENNCIIFIHLSYVIFCIDELKNIFSTIIRYVLCCRNNMNLEYKVENNGNA